MSRKVWWNGKIIDEKDAKISIYDSALMFGDTIFEMTRSFKGKHFKLEEHLDRLWCSAKYTRMKIPYDKKQIINAIDEVTNLNSKVFRPEDEHRLLIQMTRGILSIYNDIDVEKGVNFIISDFPLRWTVAGMGDLFDEGINLAVPHQRAIPSGYLESRIKSRSRMHLLMANQEVANYKGEHNYPLLLNEDGTIAEGTGYNFFCVKGHDIITPKAKNILRGISRDFVLSFKDELAEYNFIEDDILLYDAIIADECFITATPFCMLPVKSINNISITTDFKIFDLLLDYWSKWVGVNIKEQIKQWNESKLDGTNPYKFKG
jgi:branched-chain amino acid aminotransferase